MSKKMGVCLSKDENTMKQLRRNGQMAPSTRNPSDLIGSVDACGVRASHALSIHRLNSDENLSWKRVVKEGLGVFSSLRSLCGGVAFLTYRVVKTKIVRVSRSPRIKLLTLLQSKELQVLSNESNFP